MLDDQRLHDQHLHGQPLDDGGGELDEPTFEIHVQPSATNAVPPLPAPSWEQPALFDGEPVDAYGTPMSLVDALRKSEEELRAEIGDVEAAQWNESAVQAAPVQAAPEPRAASEDEGDDGGDVESVGTPVPLVVAPHGFALQNGTQLEETDLDSDLEESLETDLEDGDESELDRIARSSLESDLDLDLDEEESEPRPAAETLEPATPLAEARADDSPPMIPEPPRKPAIVAPSLFEEPAATAPDTPSGRAAEAPEPAATATRASRPARSSSKGEPKRAATEAPELSEVVLQPQAPPPAGIELAVDPKVFKAGCLFVERQRVAVSMLQREFGFDFQEATDVLDQLQRVGLIGPYLGGQRRDILLTLEQWKEKVGAG